MRKLAVILVAAAIPALANADVNSDAKAFAKGINARLEQSTKQTDPSIVPNYQGTDVDAAKHYDSGFNIENEAQEQAATDPIAKFIVEGYNSRPKSILGPNDPILKRLDEIDKNATSLTDTYDGCTELPVGAEDKEISVKKSCSVISEKYKKYNTCTVSVSPSCKIGSYLGPQNSNITLDIKWNGSVSEIGRSGVKVRYQTATFTVNLLTGTYSATFSAPRGAMDSKASVNSYSHSPKTSLDYYCGNGEPTFTVGSQSFYYNGANLQVTQYPSCANGMTVKFVTGLASGSSPTPGALYDLIRSGVKVTFKISRPESCEIQMDETRSCAPYSARQGVLTNRVCTNSGDRLVLNTIKANGCWEYKESYEWDAIRVTDESECKALRDQGCAFVGSVCTNSVDGFCLNETQSYSCSALTPARTVTLCGSNLICPDGSCTADVGRSYDPATDDFKEAASRLTVAQEIADQIDMDTFTIFKGKPLECQNKTLGMSNCCKDSGWLHDIGLGSCDAEEKELGLAKEAKKTVYVGSYDRGSFLDKRTYKAYCSYPSKLGRIIIQQARPQLGLGFGSPSNPVCDGLTLEQFEQVDFNRIDLSEFYSDAMDKADSSVNPLELVEALKERMQSLYGGASQ